MTLIDLYIADLENSISNFDFVVFSEISYSRYDDFSATLKGKIQIDGYNLVFMEIVYLRNNLQKRKVRYSYHLMNLDNQLVFRYDNAPNHKEIKSFPHHKHTVNSIIESDEPDLKSVLYEIETYYTSF